MFQRYRFLGVAAVSSRTLAQSRAVLQLKQQNARRLGNTSMLGERTGFVDMPVWQKKREMHDSAEFFRGTEVSIIRFKLCLLRFEVS